MILHHLQTTIRFNIFIVIYVLFFFFKSKRGDKKHTQSNISEMIIGQNRTNNTSNKQTTHQINQPNNQTNEQSNQNIVQYNIKLNDET